MKKKIASLVAAGLMLLGGAVNAGPAEALTLPQGVSMGSSSISGALGANAPRGTVVKQGDEILTDEVLSYGSCTLGYVDRRAGIGYTAGHCGFAGQPVLNTRRQIIGYFESSTMITRKANLYLDYGAQIFPELGKYTYRGPMADTARIRFVPGVTVGGNSLSGDRIVPLREIRSGDKVCATGISSRRVSCGVVDRVHGQTIFAHHTGLRHGDSGGPAWIPGKGFIGVNSAKEWGSRSGYRMTFAHPHG
ncbi:hypothetical protein [Corynebacterium sp. HMSC074A01]|uniref:hypothetical protein n=1 Tax=Corynebacterium sp. HMSC074A01 TaxID=1715030 RepID=UPI0008A5A982|nr:hypothetical protein [Corynebacterium sp. HMSC074A01]OHF40301.1 hypothetical protein HMPREF2550_00360 [Corynebacterium sp. HMSC074A01]